MEALHRGDVTPRRAPVPARSAAKGGTKRPAHSCALTHRPHVARRRHRRFAQNWSRARAGRALRGGWERWAGSERCAGRHPPPRPPRRGFPKTGKRGSGGGDARGSPRWRGRVRQGATAGWESRQDSGGGPEALPVLEPRFPHLPNGDAQGTVVSPWYEPSQLVLTPAS